MILNLRVLAAMIRHGSWEWGWEMYKDKPMLDVSMTYYDGYWFAIHVGPFWVQGEL